MKIALLICVNLEALKQDYTTLMHEPAVTVSRKYGSTELQDTKYKAALGKLLPDSPSWKNEVYFE